MRDLYRRLLFLGMSIFKANDIRGVYGTELRDADAYAIGSAFVRFLRAKRVVVGRDCRVSSPALHAELIRGIVDTGCDVIDSGLIDSPGFYFATHYFGIPGIMITASHNPAHYNGFYLCKKDGESINVSNGLLAIEKLASEPFVKKARGKVIQKNILSEYTSFVLSFIDITKIKPLSLVIDAGNGMGAPIGERVFAQLPLTITKLFWAMDGRFPHHEPNPIARGALDRLSKEVIRKKADLGIAFDGDADRVTFVDNRGMIVEGSVAGVLLARSCTKKKDSIIYSSTCSRILPESIKESGGKPLMEHVGHSFMNLRMRKEKAAFGAEDTGHYFYKKAFYTDSGIISALLLCEFLSISKVPLSDLVRSSERYYRLPEITLRKQFDLYSVEKAIKAMKPNKVQMFDGVRFDFGDAWGSIRTSQTEPVTRIVLEGNDKKSVLALKKKILTLMKRFKY